MRAKWVAAGLESRACLIPNGILLKMRKKKRSPAEIRHCLGPDGRSTAGRERAVCVVIRMKPESQLLEIIRALNSCRGQTYLLHSSKHNPSSTPMIAIATRSSIRVYADLGSVLIAHAHVADRFLVTTRGLLNCTTLIAGPHNLKRHMCRANLLPCLNCALLHGLNCRQLIALSDEKYTYYRQVHHWSVHGD